MARCAKRAGVVSNPGRVLAASLGILLSLPLHAEQRLTLQEFGKRNKKDFSPVYAGQTVVVRGVVNAGAFHFVDRNVLTIDDGEAGGVLMVKQADPWLDKYMPGDELEVKGKVTVEYGMPAINPEEITQVGHT